jgi:hypothetical protein
MRDSSQRTGGSSFGRPGGASPAAEVAGPGKRTLVDGLGDPATGGGSGTSDLVMQGGATLAQLIAAVKLQATQAKAKAAKVADPKAAGVTAEFDQAVLALHAFCKTSLPSPSAMQALVGGPGSADKKVAAIGQLAVLRSHIEFLVGWIYHGGLRRSVQGWEDKPGKNLQNTDSSSNHGTLVDGYVSGTQARDDGPAGMDLGSDWCGMYINSIHKALGGKGVFVDHDNLFRYAGTLKYADPRELGSGGRRIVWNKDLERWEEAAYGVPAGARKPLDPQAGDVVAVNGYDHIAMVERYDTSSKAIRTIDANAGLWNTSDAATAVTGRTYQPEQVNMVIRIGLESYAGAAAGGGEGKKDGEIDTATLAQIRTSLSDAERQLIDLQSFLYGIVLTPGATVDDWVHKDAAKTTQP